MESFLRLTAQHLYERFGNRLSDIAVIFPNNRAKLFFGEHLYQLAGKPIWTPSFLTVNDLFRSQTKLKVADNLTLVAHLHQAYQQVSQRDESFDEFYLWGELLLSDFDDVDKNLADATQLFRNIKEQAAFTDTLEHLSEEQVQVIRRFFDHFDPSRKTELKRRFIENWNCLMQVYTLFRETLESRGLAYEGMLNRKVTEALRNREEECFPFERYAFVGFNVLNQCEKLLFKQFQLSGKALFYWDYDNSYLKVGDHEAGRFMRQNLELFPNQLENNHFNAFSEYPKHIRFVASNSENAQARYLPDWIVSLGQEFKPEETAVVLCNESLLMPVLHSIPEKVQELNVTMGFPLSQAPVSNLLTRICQLHAAGKMTDKNGVVRFNYRHVLPLLQHPLVKRASQQATAIGAAIMEKKLFRIAADCLQQDALLRALFSPVTDSVELAGLLMNVLTLLSRGETIAEKDPDLRGTVETPPTITPVGSDNSNDATVEDDPLFQESVFQCYTLVSRLKDTLSEELVEVSLPTFTILLQRVISVTSIPFSGEPVRGLQIMGMLETRTLDFKNVLVLSVNEGMLPKTANDVSFIPYNLRKGFGLTTSDHKDSIYAYYFFRLLQRAENITLAYNTSSEGLNRGEMSRFMLQLLVESPHRITAHRLRTNMGLTGIRELQVNKSERLLDVMFNRFDTNRENRLLAPTALNTYIDCPLRFYLRYIAGIKEQDTLSDEIDGAMLGTLFHHAAEYLYTDTLLRKSGKRTKPADIEEARSLQSVNRDLLHGNIKGIITSDDLEPWIKGARSIEKLARYVMGIDFFRLPADAEETPDFNGEQLIRLKLLTHFLQKLVELDQKEAPFNISGLETRVETQVTVDTVRGPFNLRLGGTIDRMHEKDDCLFVMDYKTGGEPTTAKSVEELFLPRNKRASYILQILTYCAIVHRHQPNRRIKPQLLYINKAGSEEYAGDIQIGSHKEKTILHDYAPIDNDFWKQIKKLLQEMFDPDLPFTQCKETATCEYCPYKSICKR